MITASQVATDAQLSDMMARLQGVNPGGNGYLGIPPPAQYVGEVRPSGDIEVLVTMANTPMGLSYMDLGTNPAALQKLGIAPGAKLNHDQTVALVNAINGVSSSGSSAVCFSLVPGETCVGPIGQKTLLFGAVGLVALFLLTSK